MITKSIKYLVINGEIKVHISAITPRATPRVTGPQLPLR
jgi:hypothetical protein